MILKDAVVEIIATLWTMVSYENFLDKEPCLQLLFHQFLKQRTDKEPSLIMNANKTIAVLSCYLSLLKSRCIVIFTYTCMQSLSPFFFLLGVGSLLILLTWTYLSAFIEVVLCWTSLIISMTQASKWNWLCTSIRTIGFAKRYIMYITSCWLYLEADLWQRDWEAEFFHAQHW